MPTDDALDAVLGVFPGAEVVEGAAPVAVSAPAGRSDPPVGDRPSRPSGDRVRELSAATEAMVGWFRENEPARLNRAGWKRVIAALDAVARLDDPDRDEVQLRAGAGETERAAARAVFPASGTQRRSVLEAVAAAGEDGLCDHEIEAGLGMNPSSVRPRRGELADGGWVEDSGLRRQTPSGADAVVWVLTDAGRRALADG